MANQRLSAAAWREHIARWRDSGVPIHAYAEQSNLALSRLAYWARRLEREAPSPPLVPVQVHGAALTGGAGRAGAGLLMIDEIGYLPMNRNQAKLFVQVIAALHERSSLIVTSNLQFDQWDATFASDTTLTAALLDWVLHHAHVVPIIGRSYRLKRQHQAGLVRRDDLAS